MSTPHLGDINGGSNEKKRKTFLTSSLARSKFDEFETKTDLCNGWKST
jgi:hypothetical protein